MAPLPKHKWLFRPRFSKGKFGWKSQPAIKRIKEAVSEIKKVSKKQPSLAAEGAVLFLEKVAPAIEHVDSSSGSIGIAVNNAIESLVPIIINGYHDDKTYNAWLERLWEAIENDDIPYIELLPEFWGNLCITKERASIWADTFLESTKFALSAKRGVHIAYNGISSCFSALFTAQRYTEIFDLIKLPHYTWWHYTQWGVKSLAAQGHIDEAIAFAHNSQGLNDSEYNLSTILEEILLEHNRMDEAYQKYAIAANRKNTFIATFRAIKKKYTTISDETILNDLIASTPGEEGKWFATAKTLKFFNKAKELANTSPCDPKTLTRAAKEYLDSEPEFAHETAIAAIKWLEQGYGYEITGSDILAAFQYATEAASKLGRKKETSDRLKELVSEKTWNSKFLWSKILKYLEC